MCSQWWKTCPCCFRLPASFYRSLADTDSDCGLVPHTSRIDLLNSVRYQGLKKKGWCPKKMTALSEQRWLEQSGKNRVISMIIYLAILFCFHLETCYIFVSMVSYLKIKTVLLIKITSSKRKCDASLRNIITNLKFCFCWLWI